MEYNRSTAGSLSEDMWEETNPYASPESSFDAPADDERSTHFSLLRTLTVGPALMFLVGLGFLSLAAPWMFWGVGGALVLLHRVDRMLFESKKFFG